MNDQDNFRKDSDDRLRRAQLHHQAEVQYQRSRDGAERLEDGKNYPYQPSQIWLGKTSGISEGFWGNIIPVQDVGISIDKAMLTVAGPRSGKGAACIIPNLYRWPDNALVIDPKGEAADVTAAYRQQNFRQSVYVIDPFETCNRHSILRASFNPLDALDPNSMRIVEDIGIIVDGLIMRSDDSAAHWDGGGSALLKGLIAHIITTLPKESHTLLTVREAFKLPPDKWDILLQNMAENAACGGLPQAAAQALSRRDGEYFKSVADRNTEWLDSQAMENVLSESTFDLSQLKTGECSVYLVLPPEMLEQHGRFLRLFVRLAILAMAKGGTKGRRCLFILDEFYALGYMSEIDKAAGLMPGYGVLLWPILQDWGQAIKLYGREGAQKFLGGTTARQFFGNNDPETLNLISQLMGFSKESESTFMRPEEVESFVAKGPNDQVSPNHIVFMPGAPRMIRTYASPYWADDHLIPEHHSVVGPSPPQRGRYFRRITIQADIPSWRSLFFATFKREPRRCWNIKIYIPTFLSRLIFSPNKKIRRAPKWIGNYWFFHFIWIVSAMILVLFLE